MKRSPASSGALSRTFTYTPLELPSSRSWRWSWAKTSVAAWGAMNASASSICVPELPTEFSMWSSTKAVPGALPFSITRLAMKGGGVSSSMASATDAASTASSSAGTGAVSEVDSSSIRSAATWMEGGGSGSGGLTASIFGGGALLAKGVPQSKQNFAAGGLEAPQLEQIFSDAAGSGAGGAFAAAAR